MGKDASVLPRVLFATAELVPVARVGGLAAATAGLVRALRGLGVEVDVVVPDYDATPLAGARSMPLAVPEWAGPATARTGVLEGVGELTLVSAYGVERSHPYLQPDGTGWPDNDRRFMAFSAAIGALVTERKPDVLHLNDWHTAAALAFLAQPPPTVLTVHTLGYQGRTNPGWLAALRHHRESYRHQGDTNPLAGGIRLADLVIAVSPTYAREIRTPAGGAGLDGVLREAEPKLVGILNGIDTDTWDPARDPDLVATYSSERPEAKRACRDALRDELGLPPSDAPLAVMVTRLVEQKGVDLVLPVIPFLDRLPTQLAVLGDGDEATADALGEAVRQHPDAVAFRRGYDEALAHRFFAGGDLLLMPSRFEPCGLAQMQAMRYGTLPVVTDVGGLRDTVVDLDVDPLQGTGIVAAEVSALGVLDGLHRARRVTTSPTLHAAARRRGMTADWSWRQPALDHLAHYRHLQALQSTTATTTEAEEATT